MIQVSNLTKYYGNKLGIADLSFTIKKGEIVGFLGPNAAGKTTTMRIMTGFMPATRGVAEIAGYDVMDEPMEVKRRVGYLPENPPLYREMTVTDYLRFVAEVKEVPRKHRKSRIDEVIDMAGLQGVRKRLIQNISRGYRQRTGLAQALINRPEVLILDEPTVGLDPKQIIEIRNLIKNLAGERTVILSSHVLPEISMVCNRVMIINKGRMIAEDSTDQLSQRLQGTQRLNARVRGPGRAVADKINGIDGVASCSVDDDSQPYCSLTVDAEPGDEVKERLFFALSKAGWPLVELTRVQLSLEEVFLQLTTEEDASEEGDK